jgi:hypothetical protein
MYSGPHIPMIAVLPVALPDIAQAKLTGEQ